MIDKKYFEPVDIDTLKEAEFEELYTQLNSFNNYVYDFVIKYHKYLYEIKDYGTGLSLSMLEAHLITDIVDEPGITASTLAKKWEKTPAFISQTLKTLEKDEFIYRELNKDNRKFYNIFPTQKGIDFDLCHKKYDIRSILTTNQELMKTFSLDDLIQMRLMMEEYINIISKEHES